MNLKKEETLRPPSKKTKRNWQIDAVLFFSTFAVTLSSIYFLYFPNGFQGGRNPNYNTVVIFDRITWDLIHTWTGIVMIVVALIHFLLHWRWFFSIGKRIWRQYTDKKIKMNSLTWINLVADLTVGIGFFLAAISGINFLFVVEGRSASDPLFIFNRTTWDMIHTWAGVAMLLGAVAHFIIHWRWIVNVTIRYFKTLFKGNSLKPELPQNSH